MRPRTSETKISSQSSPNFSKPVLITCLYDIISLQMSNNIGNNDSMAQGAENGSGVRGRRRRRPTNDTQPILSRRAKRAIPEWMHESVRLVNYSQNQPTNHPITYQITLHHYDREETTMGSRNVEGVEDINWVERLETIIEE
ncbi:unnamed protein product [Macrosiphum euphorbiae]|uniref:Uncharacterized protein n=1 Tax=Macrosiphum euphorbiae TaxID=13131 RepID=A0AAV0VL06_9HEMI|nr:unnamed protein product [Macrosiphum euphorbiae]